MISQTVDRQYHCPVFFKKTPPRGLEVEIEPSLTDMTVNCKRLWTEEHVLHRLVRFVFGSVCGILSLHRLSPPWDQLLGAIFH